MLYFLCPPIHQEVSSVLKATDVILTAVWVVWRIRCHWASTGVKLVLSSQVTMMTFLGCWKGYSLALWAGCFDMAFSKMGMLLDLVAALHVECGRAVTGSSVWADVHCTFFLSPHVFYVSVYVGSSCCILCLGVTCGRCQGESIEKQRRCIVTFSGGILPVTLSWWCIFLALFQMFRWVA